MQGKKQYQEKLFTSFQLSDRVSAGNFYRRLKDILDLQWLYKATLKYYGTEGQSSIDPVVFFRFMLIGYLENIISDRRLIATVNMRMDMLFFIGYDIDEPLPWHSTLSRTRQLYGEEVFKELFKKILKQCIDKGMVSGVRQAVDSVFVKANASMDSVLEKEVLKDADTYAEQLREEDNKNDEEHPESTTNKKVKKSLSNEIHYSSTDADARISTKTNKPTQLNYLGQVSVDAAHHVITNIEAHYADKKDSDCLAEVLDHTIANLAAEGVLVEEVLCDGNYNSGKALRYLEKNDIIGYIPDLGQYKAERKGFIFHKQDDYYECSQGKKLIYKSTYPDRDGYYKKHYHSNRKDCRECPIKDQCLGKSSKEKKLADTVDKPLYDRMHIRMQTSRAKYMRKVRQSTVEPVIGSLACYFGMRKVNTIGIRQANKCILMSAVAYNLKKMMKWVNRKTETIVKAIEVKQQKSFLVLGYPLQPPVHFI